MLFNNGPNIVAFQLATGDEQFYVIGIYIPPEFNKGVDELQRAWDACSLGCKPIVLGDLNINCGFPRDVWEEVIVDLLDEINLIDMWHWFQLRTPQRASTRAGGCGVRSTKGRGITCSQTMSWLVKGR